MAQIPVQPPKPPTPFANGSGFGKSTPSKEPACMETNPPKAKAPIPSSSGHHGPTSGGTVWDNGSHSKRSYRMIVVSRILKAHMGRENINTVPRQDYLDCAAPEQTPDHCAAPPQDPDHCSAPRQM